MATPKARTIQQRFGFADKDLKKPKHDEMIIWLDAVVDQFLEEWIGYERYWSDDTKENAFNWIAEEIYDFREGNRDYSRGREVSERLKELPLPDKPKLNIKEKIWEYAISTGHQNQYIVGFVDMLVTYRTPSITVGLHQSEEGSYSKKHLPRVDIEYRGDTWGDDRSCFKILFEAKTEIPSLGELLRQIRMYQKYINGKWFVVCPDDHFKVQLEAQGIGLIKYDPSLLEPDEVTSSDGCIYQIPLSG